MNLANGLIGKSYIVEDMQLESGIMRRLQVLGLTQGTLVEVMNKKKNGTVIFRVRGTRFAIGNKIANGILLDENSGGKINE